ncbi:MAG TPA: NAD-dependent deacylase [Candidatus Limnocylindrales bacterium]|nr:NAD-dependent deacylase [Candidatus Limnocylindrales bacterium]
MIVDDRLQHAAVLLRASQHPVVLTGAGVSAESGVPTFRDLASGLWSRYDATELATPQAFQRDPDLVWRFYQYRRKLTQQARPNPGHYALAELEQIKPDLQIITQNVDGLHEEAGSTHVIRLHGRLSETKCSQNCKGDPTLINLDEYGLNSSETAPRCPHCSARLRPYVVWFNELIPGAPLERAWQAIAKADLMLVVGTSGLVYPAADMPMDAHDRGVPVIEVNPKPTALTAVADVLIAAPSGEALPELVRLLAEPA